MRTIHAEPATDTYNETERLIYHTVQEFVRVHGGKFEDAKEYAGLSFMKAYLTYNNERGTKFTMWLRYRVWKNLLEVYRKRARNEHKVVFVDLTYEPHAAKPQFNHVDFMDSLSEDARLVVRLVFDTPWQLEPDPAAIRTLLREYLQQPAIGWPAARIRQTFAEIRQALRLL